MSDGEHDIVWKTNSSGGEIIKSGIYYYSISAGKYYTVKKMVVVRWLLNFYLEDSFISKVEIIIYLRIAANDS